MRSHQHEDSRAGTLQDRAVIQWVLDWDGVCFEGGSVGGGEGGGL